MLLGTSNPAKQRKLAWLVEGLGYLLITPRELALADEPAEHGESHRQVAADKARFWSYHGGGLAIASDGGARIPALEDRWDSLLTRRAAGPAADDRDRAEHLLRLMRGRRGADRDVVWVEGLALARAGKLLVSWQAEGHLGRLVTRYEPSAIAGGFWMAGLLHVPRFDKLYARLSADELAQVDDAWNELRPRVRTFLRQHRP